MRQWCSAASSNEKRWASWLALYTQSHISLPNSPPASHPNSKTQAACNNINHQTTHTRTKKKHRRQESYKGTAFIQSDINCEQLNYEQISSDFELKNQYIHKLGFQMSILNFKKSTMKLGVASFLDPNPEFTSMMRRISITDDRSSVLVYTD